MDVSSAHATDCTQVFDGKLFTTTKNQKGSSTDLCGTPHLSESELLSDLSLLSELLTLCERFSKYDRNRLSSALLCHRVVIFIEKDVSADMVGLGQIA